MTRFPEPEEPSPESSQGHTQSMKELYGLGCEHGQQKIIFNVKLVNAGLKMKIL